MGWVNLRQLLPFHLHDCWMHTGTHSDIQMRTIEWKYSWQCSRQCGIDKKVSATNFRILKILARLNFLAISVNNSWTMRNLCGRIRRKACRCVSFTTASHLVKIMTDSGWTLHKHVVHALARHHACQCGLTMRASGKEANVEHSKVPETDRTHGDYQTVVPASITIRKMLRPKQSTT